MGDCTGRGPLAAYFPCPLNRVWGAVLLRCGIIAAICLCVPPLALSTAQWPLMALVLVLGMTTGYLGTSVISVAPTTVDPGDRETTGYVSILAIFLGLMLGSAASYGLKAALGS